MPVTVYGVKVAPHTRKLDYWLSENRMALRALLEDQDADDSVTEADIHEVSLESLREYEETQGILRTRICLVEAKYEISDPTETEKIFVPFLHFHDADKAWEHFHEKCFSRNKTGAF